MCAAIVVNELGGSIDNTYELIDGDLYIREARTDLFTSHQLFTPVDFAVISVFESMGLPMLGGTSGLDGWSSMSTYQRCPYAWAREHVAGFIPVAHPGISMFEPFGRAVGTLVHVYLAIYYQRKIDKNYPLTPEMMQDGIRKRSVDPAIVLEGWRLFSCYRIYYFAIEKIQPIAVEVRFVSPKSGRTCRADLLCIKPGENDERPAGLYLMDHKTALFFSETALTGWHNEGAIMQQAEVFADAWEVDPELQKYGPLRGVIINIIGKQKVPEFHRTFVHPNHFQMEAHRQEMPYWKAQRDLSIATGVFPRARAGCLTHYGKCDHWEHCLGAQP